MNGTHQRLGRVRGYGMSQFLFEYDRHPVTGWDIVRLTCRQQMSPRLTQIEIAPAMGCNLLSFRVDDHNYLVDLERGTSGEPQLLGTPILYPTPNRVRDARFTFRGRTFRFTANNGPNFIHGLVRDKIWSMGEPALSRNSASITGRYRLEPGGDAYALFPIRNSLEVIFTLRPGGLGLRFAVHNEDESSDLPFGLAIHPYFRIIGDRRDVRLQVPAERAMEAVDLLPTGRLVSLEGSPGDLREPRPLSELDLDDVYWGLSPSRPQVIYYDRLRKRLVLSASEMFTHSVVYTPPDRGYFCVESQSCSTDAHNLYARGLEAEAHLIILRPGESTTGWIDMDLRDQDRA